MKTSKYKVVEVKKDFISEENNNFKYFIAQLKLLLNLETQKYGFIIIDKFGKTKKVLKFNSLDDAWNTAKRLINIKKKKIQRKFQKFNKKIC